MNARELQLRKEKRQYELKLKEIEEELKTMVEVPFSEIKVGESFIYRQISYTKLAKNKSILNGGSNYKCTYCFDTLKNKYLGSKVNRFLYSSHYIENILHSTREDILSLELLSINDFFKYNTFIKITDEWWLKDSTEFCRGMVVRDKRPLLRAEEVTCEHLIRPMVNFNQKTLVIFEKSKGEKKYVECD